MKQRTTKDGKRPLTPRGFRRFKAARERYIKITNSARDIENLLDVSKGKETVAYALRAILFQLSSESGINVETPGVAGVFYKTAAFQLHGSTDIHIQQTLRHLDVLLNNPDYKTASVLIKYWDNHKTKDRKVDPFPAKPDPFAATKPHKSQEGQS